MTALARELAAATAIFFLLYNISFQAAPPVTTGRVVLLVLLVLGGPSLVRLLVRTARQHAVWVTWIAGLAGYSLLLWYFSGRVDLTQTSRLLNFAVFVLLAPVVVLATCAPTLERLVRAVTLAALAQAGFIVLAYLSPEFRGWTASVLVQGGNIPLRTAFQVAGFSNSAGAAHSVTQAAGAFCAIYASRLATRPRTAALYVAAAVAIGASAVLVGRTGMLLSVVFIVAGLGLAARLRHVVTSASVLTVVAALVVYNFDAIVDRAYLVNPAVGRTLTWSLGAFTRLVHDPSVQELAGTPIPPLEVDTLLGTGLVTSHGTNASGHDSGYVQTYYALGLVAAILFYGGFALMLLRGWLRQRERLLLALLILAIFAVELKEPFIFKYAAPQVAVALLLAGAGRRGIRQGPAGGERTCHNPELRPRRSRVTS